MRTPNRTDSVQLFVRTPKRPRRCRQSRWVTLTPQPTQRQRCEPDLVFPLRFMGDPQDGHVVLFTATSGNRRLFAMIFAMRPAETSISRHTFCPSGKVVSFEFYNKKWTMTWVNVHFWTHFLSYKPEAFRLLFLMLYSFSTENASWISFPHRQQRRIAANQGGILSKRPLHLP